jgi:hypothetical protein
MVNRKEKKGKKHGVIKIKSYYLCGDNAKESVFSINVITFDKTCEQ